MKKERPERPERPKLNKIRENLVDVRSFGNVRNVRRSRRPIVPPITARSGSGRVARCLSSRPGKPRPPAPRASPRSSPPCRSNRRSPSPRSVLADYHGERRSPSRITTRCSLDQLGPAPRDWRPCRPGPRSRGLGGLPRSSAAHVALLTCTPGCPLPRPRGIALKAGAMRTAVWVSPRPSPCRFDGSGHSGKRTPFVV